jgi:osmotically-inducible protein OsmY
MPADLELALKVRDKLTATRRDLGNLAILVHDGNVCLRGRVPSYHLRQMAVERARRVPGVRLITDELRVADA